LAEYKVVEVTQLDLPPGEIGSEKFRTALTEFCPVGWEIISARLLAEDGIQRALVILSR